MNNLRNNKICGHSIFGIILFLAIPLCLFSQSIPDTFRSSDLPIIIIDTKGAVILDEPKIKANIGILDRTNQRNFLKDSFSFQSQILIEKRGSSSQQLFPQASYSIKFIDSLGEERNASVLGMPEEHDWILYAPYNDKTCMRNVLSYYLSQNMGMYASRTRYCEVMLNNEYQGLYVWMEKIKRDSNRVDISKMTSSDTSGEDLTGGYIIKLDKINGAGGDGFTSRYPTSLGNNLFYQYEYPRDENILQVQKNYIKNYLDSFETALKKIPFNDLKKGYRNYANVDSWINYFILNEISRNVDGYRISTFLYKDKNKKWHIGPPWDYNLAWWNANYCQGNLENGWAYDFNTYCSGDPYRVPFWWDQLLLDTSFQNQLKCRYLDLRKGILSIDHLFTTIDSFASLTIESRQRHFMRWPILGNYVWPNPSPIPKDYPSEILALKNFITKRLAWIDQNLPGQCKVVTSNHTNQEELDIQIYPQPVTNLLHISTYGRPLEYFQLIDFTGRSLDVSNILKPELNGDYSLEMKSMINGIYFIVGQSDGIRFSKRILLMN